MKKVYRYAIGDIAGSTFTPACFPVVLTILVLFTFGLAAPAQNFSPYLTGPYTTMGGKLFIRTYLVYCQTSSETWAGALGPDERRHRTAGTLRALNEAFNPHDIFFVPGVFDQGNCDTVATQINQSPWPEFSDGLTIHVYSDDNGSAAHPSGSLYSTTLPATKFWVRGNENGTPAAHLPIIVNLAGYCLGLVNTAAFTAPDGAYLGPSPSCKPTGCAGSNNVNNCCGDLVNDTGQHGFGQIIWTSGCEAIETPPGLDLEISRNYMTNSFPTRCRDRFTVQQANRMRQYLIQAPVLAPLQIVPEIVPAGAPVVWSLPASKFTNVEVPAGATLVVDGVLEMAPGTYIVVRRGGTLIVNGRITAGCAGMWGGIVVEGNGNFPQKETNGQLSSNQGRLVLNTDGVLEHAQTGIGVYGFENSDDIDDGGGIVEIFGRIRNCTKGIQFERYRRNNLPNASTVSGAFLTLDGNYRGTTAAQPELLHLRAINRLDIWGTWFYDSRTQNCTGRTSRAKGLVADDAAFRLRSSLFRNLDRGILSHPMDQSGGYGAYEVGNCTFLDCYTGIESNLPDRFSITNCHFLVGRPPACPASTGPAFAGIRIPGAYPLPEGIELKGNQFRSGNHQPGDTLVGLDCTGTGGKQNTFRNNTFEALTYGIRAAGNNGGAQGLIFECNRFETSREADIFVLPGSSVRTIQGDSNLITGVTTAAGNRFRQSGRSWLNKGAPVVYYYSNVPGQIPADAVLLAEGIAAQVATQPNPWCAVPAGDCPLPCHIFQNENWTESPVPQIPGQELKTAPDADGDSRSGQVLSDSDLPKAVVRIYPNPTTGQFFVELPEGSGSVHVQLLSPDGRVARNHFLSGSDWLDVSELPPGLYLCRVVDAGGIRVVTKLVIAR